jgi:hypothetical protein
VIEIIVIILWHVFCSKREDLSGDRVSWARPGLKDDLHLRKVPANLGYE